MKALTFVFAIASISVLMQNVDGRYLLLKLNEIETIDAENFKAASRLSTSLKCQGTG